jgi:hypothetical protein
MPICEVSGKKEIHFMPIKLRKEDELVVIGGIILNT